MIKNTLLAFVLFFIFSSCVPQRVKNNFTYCFNNNETELGSLINLEGFYYLLSKSDTSDLDPLKSPSAAFIFYSNGFTTTKHPSGWLNYNIDDKFSFFGKYNLINDTIKGQFLGSPTSMSMNKYEVWFKVIDVNTIEMIYKGSGIKVTKNDFTRFKLRQYYLEHGAKFVFYPLKKLPDINKTYIIKRKWFWCDKPGYKIWKKQHK